jgi:hypothetical protein
MPGYLHEPPRSNLWIQAPFAFLRRSHHIHIERDIDHGPNDSQQDGAIKSRAPNVPPEKKSAAVAMKVVGSKNQARAAKAAKKSATQKDPPAAIVEAPTTLPAVTLADTTRYLSCFSLLLSLTCRRCNLWDSRCCRRRNVG